MLLHLASTSAAQKLDIYLPAGDGPFPVVVVIHGGGFMVGDKATPTDWFEILPDNRVRLFLPKAEMGQALRPFYKLMK